MEVHRRPTRRWRGDSAVNIRTSPERGAGRSSRIPGSSSRGLPAGDAPAALHSSSVTRPCRNTVWNLRRLRGRVPPGRCPHISSYAARLFYRQLEPNRGRLAGHDRHQHLTKSPSGSEMIAG